MESVMRLSVCLSVCLVCSVVLEKTVSRKSNWRERNAMRCDAIVNNSNSSKMGERGKERASVEREREREREQSQRLDSGLNVVSAIRLAGNPKMPICASLMDPFWTDRIFYSCQSGDDTQEGLVARFGYKAKILYKVHFSSASLPPSSLVYFCS